MDNNDDFTFCKVDQVGPETKKLTAEMDGISINGDVGPASNRSGSRWKDNSPNTTMSKKQDTVGSLSFTVIEASNPKQQSSKRSKQPISGNVGQIKKPTARAKVPFEKGYSPMDWVKLTRTHPDLAGLNGESNKRLIPMSEVKQHRSEGSMWTVLKGRVYNLTPYMRFHPGGVDILKKAVGKDCTSLFNKYHAWVNAEFLLEKCLVGILDDSQVQKRKESDCFRKM